MLSYLTLTSAIMMATTVNPDQAATAEAVGPFLENDHILFLGDDITQQMFYTRAVATAFLGMYPRGGLHFFNGGWDGATPGSCRAWVNDLLQLTQPNVVFVMFGFNIEPGDEGVEKYRHDLEALVDQLKDWPSVRHIILLGPPPFEEGLAPGNGAETAINQTLHRLNDVCAGIAKIRQLGFIEMFSPMKAVYLESTQVGGEPLTLNGRHPSETGHMVIAGIILRGLRVTADQLDRPGWSPMLPRDMARIRPALGVSRKAPSLAAAERSRAIYLSLVNYDQAFFRAWRLGRRKRRSPSRSREQMIGEAQALWKRIEASLLDTAADAESGKHSSR